MYKYLPIILLLFSAPLSAETNWYRVAANTTLAIDWLQTHEIIKNDSFYETNKILGKYPSENELNKYFISSILLINIIGETLPKKYSDYFYITVAVVETKVTFNNYRFGVRIKF